MVTIEQLDPPGTLPALGQECRFAVHGESVAGVDYFLEHEGVLYPQALGAEADGSIRLYPEAPGRYTLHAAWRSVRGERGWTRIEFHVKGALGSAPQEITAEGETLWVPTAWDARVFSAHERSVFRELQKIIRPGATVYDIGANVGLFSARFARWIGAEGWLYAVEPNPICVYFLRANLERTRAQNFTILPVAMSHRRSDCPFTLNYGSSLLGVGGDSVVTGKPGHQIRVEGESLDTLITTFNLRRPDFIKLDVEGAEASAVAGMMETLEKSRPGFMVELHGREAAGGTLRQLGRLGYEYLSCSTAARYHSAEALLDSLPEACIQVIGFP
jgi:FkbM family methyltransferase